MWIAFLSHYATLKPGQGFMRLQALRALAAFIVMAGHVTHEAETISEATGQLYNYTPYPNAVGVDIFFVISGFVILYASRNIVGHADKALYFMKRRIARIVPIYWLYTALMIATVFAVPSMVDTIRPDLVHILKSLVFYPHIRPFGDAVRPFYALGWSLNYEMYFYVIFACLMALPLRKLIWALSAYLVGTVLVGQILPESYVALKFWFDPYVLEFLAGAWIAYFYLQGVRLPKWSYGPLWGLGVVILVVLFFPVQNSVESQLMRFVVGIILVAAATLPPQSKDVKSLPLFTALGDSSYSLYLSHPFGIGAMKVLWVGLGITLNLWIYVVLTILVCLAGGHLSYLLLERPMLRYFKARFKTENK